MENYNASSSAKQQSLSHTDSSFKDVIGSEVSALLDKAPDVLENIQALRKQIVKHLDENKTTYMAVGAGVIILGGAALLFKPWRIPAVKGFVNRALATTSSATGSRSQASGRMQKKRARA